MTLLEILLIFMIIPGLLMTWGYTVYLFRMRNKNLTLQWKTAQSKISALESERDRIRALSILQWKTAQSKISELEQAKD